MHFLICFYTSSNLGTTTSSWYFITKKVHFKAAQLLSFSHSQHNFSALALCFLLGLSPLLLPGVKIPKYCSLIALLVAYFTALK